MIMNKFLKIWIAITWVVTSFVAGFLANDWYYEDQQVYEQYKQYHKDTEALLDSIYQWDDPFLDTIGESDVYSNYCESEKKVRGL